MKRQQAIAATIAACRLERKALATEREYSGHVGRFFDWLAADPVRIRASPEQRVSGYLSDLAPRTAAATQNQALCALVFFHRAALRRPLGRLAPWAKAKRPRHLPEWLTDSEARTVLDHMSGVTRLGCALMYGAGLRVNEAAGMRWRSLDLEHRTITIRGGKHHKDRTTCLPAALVSDLIQQRTRALALWREDRARGRPGVEVPPEISRKQPRASETFGMFWVFPAAGESRDPRSGIVRRHHVIDDTFAKALALAARRAGISRRITPHALRHTFATEYLLHGGTIHELKELLGHASIQTTEVYLHCLPMLGRRVHSPLDAPRLPHVIPFSTLTPSHVREPGESTPPECRSQIPAEELHVLPAIHAQRRLLHIRDHQLAAG